MVPKDERCPEKGAFLCVAVTSENARGGVLSIKKTNKEKR